MDRHPGGREHTLALIRQSGLAPGAFRGIAGLSADAALGRML